MAVDYWEEAAMVAEAEAAGEAAAAAAVPTPMVVSDRRSGKTWHVSEGMCGFAWVIIRPGNSRVANYLKKEGKGSRSGYYGGVSVYAHPATGNGMGIARKEAYARAYADVLRGYGVAATPMSRLD